MTTDEAISMHKAVLTIIEDIQALPDINALHPREVDVLSRLSVLNNAVLALAVIQRDILKAALLSRPTSTAGD